VTITVAHRSNYQAKGTEHKEEKLSAEDIQHFPKGNSYNYNNSGQVLIICMLTQ
jgi:hypothetical protein